MKGSLFISILFAILVYTVISCKPKSSVSVMPADGNFPPDIANIMLNKCATAGCHNSASRAAGLALDSWEHLFEGDGQGAVVIPYDTTYSLLLYRVNTDPNLGFVITPTQPPTIDSANPATPLSKAEYLSLVKWILAGAPDKNGNIPFTSDADTRQKLYLADQGSDLVSVIDAKSMVVMRNIHVGLDPRSIENPHNVVASCDGKSVYVCFFSGGYIQKIDTRTDTVVESVNIGHYGIDNVGSWNVVYPSPSVDTALAATNLALGYSGPAAGSVVFLGTNPLKTEAAYGGFINGLTFTHPHGMTSNFTFDTFFIAAEYGNTIYKFFPSGLLLGNPFIKNVSVDGTSPVQSDAPTGLSDPHALLMAPDFSKYYVTCEGTNEVRVMDAHTDTLIKVLQVGVFPQEAAISTNPATPYLFVTCMQDGNNPPYNQGSVYVFDYNTYQLKTVLYGDFYQPHGICVDDRDGLVYIPSSVLNYSGPPSHHCLPGSCHAGWYSVYSLSTLKPVNTHRYEVSLAPYSICSRFAK